MKLSKKRLSPKEDGHFGGLAGRIYYDGTRYFLDTGSDFIPLDAQSVKRQLKGSGLDREQVEAAINQIQVRRYVHYAGPLAGHLRGLHEVNGSKLLATASPQVPSPRKGRWPTLRAVIDGLLGNDPEVGNQQVEVLMLWLKFAYDALMAGSSRPGQALALAGPRNSGKTLLLFIFQNILGGRRANPYPHFTGRTHFNGDLAGAELLVVDDEAGSTDIRSRKTLAASIKSSLFSGSVRIEAKHRNAFVFQPVWRMVIALNDEPEALLVLPPITEDIADKLTLLRCHRRPMPMPCYTLEEREAFADQLVAEIPALLHHLKAFEVPESLSEPRCGVIHFRHPVLEASLAELSPEGQLERLVDTVAEDGGLALPWTGTALDLKVILMGNPKTSSDARRLLDNWVAATGTYLARMPDDRVEKVPLLGGIQRWRLHPRMRATEHQQVE